MRSVSSTRLAFVAAVSIALLLLIVRAALTVRDADLSDFRCVHEAARLVVAGGDPYDRASWAAATAADPTRLPPCNEAFVYPLWTAFLFVPLAALPIAHAVAVWEVLTLAALVAAIALLAAAWRDRGLAAPLLVTTLWSQPVYSVVANAQLGGVLLLALASLTLALARARLAPAVVAWCALLLKPHVTLLPLAAVLTWPRRLAVTCLLAAGAVVLLSLAVLPSWPAELLRELSAQQRISTRGADTFSGLAAAFGVAPIWGVGASLVCAASVWAAVPRRALDPRVLLALLVPLSLVLTPYAHLHDQIVLAAAWAAVLALARPDRPLVLVVAIALVVPWTLSALTLLGVPVSLRVLVPVATAFAVAYALRRYPSA